MSCKFLVQDPVLDFSYSLPSLLRSAMCKCVSVANVNYNRFQVHFCSKPQADLSR